MSSVWVVSGFRMNRMFSFLHIVLFVGLLFVALSFWWIHKCADLKRKPWRRPLYECGQTLSMATPGATDILLTVAWEWTQLNGRKTWQGSGGWDTAATWSPFYKHDKTLIPAWISNCIHYKVWDEITYSFPNFNGWSRWSLGMEKLFHPTPYWACDYLSMLCLKLIHVSKRGLRMGWIQWALPISLWHL